MELWKIFDKTTRVVEGRGREEERGEHSEQNSISLHFCEIQQHVFFLFQSLDVSALENLYHSHAFQ